MLVASYIIMAVGLIGLIVCAKKQKTNPAMQPVAIGCLVVVLAGFGLYLFSQNHESSGEDDLVFEASTIVKAGKFLQSQASGEKILFIVPPAYVKTGRAEALLKIAKENKIEFEIAAPEVENPEEYIPEMQFKYADLEKILKEHSDCTSVIVTQMGLPRDLKPNAPAMEKHKFVIQMVDMELLRKVLPGYVNKGILVGMIEYKSGFDIDKKPDEDDMDATFDIRYQLLEKDAILKKAVKR